MSVSLEGDQCLIGRHFATYVFQRSGGVWTQAAKLSPGESADRFGSRVALAYPLALVGAYADNDMGMDSGSAFRFRHDDTSWVKTDKLLASDAGVGWGLGYSVSLDGEYAVVGTLGIGAYVFEVTTDIPAVTVWGLVVLSLMLLTAASIILRRGTCVT